MNSTSLLKIEREAFGTNPGARKHYRYVAYLRGHRIAIGMTREEAAAQAAQELLGAWNQMHATIYASVTIDGHVVTTREYQPGEVEFAHHREADGRSGSCHMSLTQIEGRPVSVAEYHQHYLEHYNDAVRPAAAAAK